ncbi:MAG TPA: right-handed parallel beta-helix repeat-containing protein [Desulfobacteraceae bacterium]|nr:right-handed parallel beta-helix repeat-containing protein [Desulfobacteraceae bacterium]HPJ69051.1 right-handed parallel beta-helix repeat-containing protein [Desulfobacteraceae bacterium]HPQ27627.1 right-handed parallel beta-helix repeat-containing protein [Desulfobacteraceae bacterium]
MKKTINITGLFVICAFIIINVLPGPGTLLKPASFLGVTKARAQEVGTLHVVITPQQAVDEGAQWRVDGGVWRNSDIYFGLEAGSHTVNYKAIPGWLTPPDDAVDIIEDQITEITGTYSKETGSLKINIGPQGAVDAGAQWNVDDGEWQNSGATVQDLAPGDHTVDYKAVAGWTSPPSETVSITGGLVTEKTGTYTQQFGSLRVFINPQGAIDEGARWRVASEGPWHDSGDTVSGLAVGDQTVIFKGIFGWTRPADIPVTINEDQVTETTGAYTKLPEGNTIRVLADHTTIQAAINAASDGDTVLVADGTYSGFWNTNLDFNGKAIKVSSENGPETCIIDGGNSARGFLFDKGEEGDSVVSGFTVTNGMSSEGHGGAIYMNGTSPTINNCTVSGNWVSADNGYGGGIYCSGGAPIINSCIISGNIASGFGGIGGGICCSGSSPTITNCTISGNSAYDYGEGGGIDSNEGSPIIINCTISGNSAGYYGGGIYCRGGATTISNCTVSGNTAGGGSTWEPVGDGGGIYCRDGSPTITNCTISGNSTTYGGGGIYCRDTSPTITNCTISGNRAPGDDIGDGCGGGIYCRYTSPTITNCIFWSDSPQEICGGTPTITYSDIQGGYTGEGNIDADPLFVDPNNANFHLTASSPCINAGNNNAANIPKTDKDGRQRIIGGTVDMGAYEFVIKAMPWLNLLLLN